MSFRCISVVNVHQRLVWGLPLGPRTASEVEHLQVKFETLGDGAESNQMMWMRVHENLTAIRLPFNRQRIADILIAEVLQLVAMLREKPHVNRRRMGTAARLEDRTE